MNETADTLDLYTLLPALYRLRDAELDYPLRGLLEVIGEQARLVKENIDGLWDDFFVETCDEWVIPYIGDLVGNNSIHEVAARRRADVARTIHYRRRKGTLPMLEELARDVTGWGAHAVAFFELLGWTQHPEHFRPQSAWTDVRSLALMDAVATAFDETSHTADVRRVAQDEGWHNIHNVGFFLWRLTSYPATGVTARRAGAPNDFGYHFSTLGARAPLFNKPLAEASAAGLSAEVNVPGPLRAVSFYEDLTQYQNTYRTVAPAARPPDSDYYGPHRSLVIIKDGVRIEPIGVMCKNLEAWARPPAGLVAVDVRLGRITFAPGEEPARSVEVSYHYGFSADIGGGEYERRRRRGPRGERQPTSPDTVADPEALTRITDAAPGLLFRVNATGTPPSVMTLNAALAAWNAAGMPPSVIQIEDNRTYEENIAINVGGAGVVTELVIQAANGQRPTLIGDITATGADGHSRLALDGLLVAGSVRVRGDLGELSLRHCTLVPGLRLREDGEPQSPGAASLVVDAGNDRLRVRVDHCIVGALRMPEEMVSLDVSDSVVDSPAANRPALAADDAGTQPGPPTTFERVTVFGEVRVRELTLASETIFIARVNAERRQKGCVRFSYVPPGSRTPRRYRSQPDLAAERAVADRLKVNPALTPSERARISEVIEAELVPSFNSRRYGQPAYAQLALRCPTEIREGAEDGAEMGAFNLLKQPQREANLKIRLEEYLPFGLEPGLIYVT